MIPKYLKRFCYKILLGGIAVFLPVCSMAQPELNRISIAERSDGLGYVVRYHLSEAVDSFKVSQPDQETVQMILYKTELDTVNFQRPAENDVIEEIHLVEVEDGMGFDFRMAGQLTFLARAYRDVSQTDLLLSLEYASGENLDRVISVNAPLFSRERDAGETQQQQAQQQQLQQPEQETSQQPEQETSQQTVEGTEHQAGNARGDSAENDKPGGGYLHSMDRMMPDDPMDLYVRAFLSNSEAGVSSYNIRPAGTLWRPSVNQTHPWIGHAFFTPAEQSDDLLNWHIYAPEIFRSYNTEIPMGQNDGALWQGRGENYSITAGAGINAGPLTVVFRPVFAYSENKEFRLSPFPKLKGLSEYAMPLMNIDSPQRFGEDSMSDFYLGDSFLQLDYRGLAAGFSNQRIWTGPAVYNPLILGYNAPGFLHAYVGTSEPYRFRYGSLETKWFWGGLEESDYFDQNPSNDRRFITGLVFNYSPDFVPGFHIGFSKVAFSYYPSNGFGVSDLFMAFRLSQHDNVTDPDNVFHSMSSLFARWVFPEAGFELYAEWGRNDNRRKIRDLLSEPEFNRGYILGFLKTIPLTNTRKLLLSTEFTNVENSSVTSTKRDFNTWYEHEVIRQGFTHRGQLLGTGIGPGSSTQVFKLSYYEKRGMLGVSAQRVAMHNDRFHRYKETYRNLYPYPEFWFMVDRHEVQMNYGLHGLLFFSYGFELQLDYNIGKFENRYNLFERDLTNKLFTVTLRYNI